MRTHAGIYRFDGVDDHDAALIAAALCGPESAHGCRTSTAGPVTVAWCDRSAQHDARPAVSGAFATRPEGRALVWEGRLDNAATLTSVLRSTVAAHDAIGDAPLVLAAYEKWGSDAFGRVIGDFSLALWDARDRTLMLARDFAGTRPLYYRVTSNEIVWSSELACFCRLGDRGARLGLDDAWVHNFLTNASDTPHAAEYSPYAGVRAVPPGTVLMVRGADRIARQRFWQPDGREVVKYAREEDYQEQFRALFRQAVSCRLTSRPAVWAELSGGLDSSSIVCMADDVLRASAREREREGEREHGFTAITYLPPQGSPGDERHYVERVEQHIGRRARRMEESEYSPFFPAALETRFLARPVNAVGRPTAVAGLLQQHGVDLLLSGTAGDHVMWSSTTRWPQFADLLARGRLLRLHRELTENGTALLGRTYWNLLWNDAIGLLRPTSRHRTYWPDWILRRGHEAEDRRAWRETSLPRTLLPSQRMTVETMANAVMTCSFHPMRTCGDVDIAYPYMDRRLVQFMMAVPFDQKLRAGRTRWLHRAALDGLLPSDVTSRASKASGAGFLCRAVNRDWNRLQGIFGADAQVVERGYVSLSGVQDALLRARRGLNMADSTYIMRVIAIESWLRNVRANSPRVLDAGDVAPIGVTPVGIGAAGSQERCA